VLTAAAWKVLLAAVRNGATLLATGVIDRDEHWMPVERSRDLGLSSAVAPVAQEETLRLDGQEWQVPFHGESFQRIEKAVIGDQETAAVQTVALGAGKVIWCPLPLETGSESAPVAALYRYALKQAGVAPAFWVEHSDPRSSSAPASSNSASSTPSSRSPASTSASRSLTPGAAPVSPSTSPPTGRPHPGQPQGRPGFGAVAPVVGAT